ncbi:MAG: ATP-binding cassette domain-containing protein [Saprospiraceae bacterium]|nr:ATP-binding cassette domain-containing protein [Saprospiraceae bacterium]
MLNTKKLQFAYSAQRKFVFPDLHCAAGDALLITGASGCGKTTLLHLLAGILHPQSGEILIGTTDLSKLTPSQADRFRGQNIGLVYQKPHFLAALSVYDNLLLAPYFGHKGSNSKDIRQLAEQLGISHTLKQLPARLSVGEQQRASIARALVNNPKLILADEPTSALDDPNCQAVITLLMQQAREHQAALVIVTHDGRLKDVVKNQIELVKQA